MDFHINDPLAAAKSFISVPLLDAYFLQLKPISLDSALW
jgi:hypothetical protein